MNKIFQSLRFQLPVVVLGVFVGILFFLALFFHEMNIILVKTRELGRSAEVTDQVANWVTTLSTGARERTKLMSLGNENYLRSFQSSLNDISGIFKSIRKSDPDTESQSMQQITTLRHKHEEYLGLLNGFAQKQMIRRQALMEVPDYEAAKEIELDSATNETFKTYEADFREGLYRVQETIHAERNDKLQSLRNSLGRAKSRLIYSLLLLLSMVAYLAMVLKWKILDPMNRLKVGAQEIGRGALGYQVQVTSKNEIGDLAEVFNRMSNQLEENQTAEVKIKRLQAIEQIVRSVNHEINNPLMIISGNAEYLLAILEGSDQTVKSKLNSIVSEVKRIFTVTQKLKAIKEPVTESYIGDKDQMIDLLRSSGFREKLF